MGTGLVDVGGQEPDAHGPALCDILCDLALGVQNGGQQGGHVLPGVVALEPGGLVGHDGVAHGVGFVEGVVGEIGDLVINALGHIGRNPVGHAAGDVAVGVPVEEGRPLPLDVLELLLGHGPADHVCLTQGVPGQTAEDLNDLLLVDDAPVGVGQDGLQGGGLVGDRLGVVLGGDEPGDGVHGTGPVQGDDSRDIFNVLGLQAHADPGHAGGFHLEHAAGLALGEHPEGGRVIVGDLVQAEVRGVGFHQLDGVIQDSEVSQGQEVHLQQPQLLQGGHGVLGDHGFVVLGQGDVGVRRVPGDDHTGGVGGGVAGHTLQALGGVDELFHRGVALIHLPEGLGQAQGVVQGDVQGVGDLLGDGVHLGVGDVQGTAHIPDGPLGGHGAEGDDLGHVVGAVFPVDVVDDLPPAAVAEVHVDIGHGHTLGVQEALEVQGVLHGVHVGDVQAVGHHGACGGTTAGAHGDVLALGIADEVGDDEEVLHKAHPADHGHLIFQLLQILLGAVGVAPGKALAAEGLKVGVPVGIPFGKLELRQVVGAELEVHIAPLSDTGGVFDGLGPVGEEGCHLLLALNVELLGLEAHPGGVLHGAAHLDAHKDVLDGGVGPGEVVGVVGDHQGNAGLLVEL